MTTFDEDIIEGEFTPETRAESGMVLHAGVPRPLSAEIGYYIATASSQYQKVGDLVYVTQVEAEKIRFTDTKDRSYTSIPEEFQAIFAFEANGQSMYHQALAEAMQEVNNVQFETAAQGQALLAYNPHIEADGSESTDLVLSVGTPIESKRAISLMRNEVEKGRNKMMAASKRVQDMVKMQTSIIEAQMTQLMKVVQRAQEAIWTINLYLGTDEEIRTLRKGEPAKDTEPITLRQLVLFMDEECAIDSEGGGIDARSMEEFDEWLLADPKHLDQVFPEQRGVVALIPKRHRKDYGDPWRNKAMDEANAHTYFLLRNGENLYRMDTEFEVGSVLVPREDEFVSFFRVTKENYIRGEFGTTTETEEVILTPGSEAYMKAMEASDARGRHFYRVALILQGLIDRTPIFHPMAEAIKVTDRRSYGRTINLIKDAERTLSDGRERFEDWRTRINSELTVGNRIIGIFNNHSYGLRDYTDKGCNSRLTPEVSSYPKDETIYTLEGTRREGCFFYFDRFDWNKVKYKVRGSCVIMPSDTFVLNMDLADPKVMREFLLNRLDRHGYMHMFHTIKVAIKMKEQEAREEAPFRQLLIGQIMETHNTDFQNAESLVPELVQWWKFKNKYHRSLLSDDAKALSMIVQEAKSRIKEQRVRAENKVNGYYTRIAAQIIREEPNVMLIGHKGGNTYVALIPETEQSVFVKEQTWVLKTGTMTMTEEKRWTTVNNRFMRWEIIHCRTERWNGWNIGASIADFLTDDERDEALPSLMKRMEAQADGANFYNYQYEKRSAQGFYKLMAVTQTTKGNIRFYYFALNLKISEPPQINTKSFAPKLLMVQASFHRTPGGKIVWDLRDQGECTFGKDGSRSWESEDTYPGHAGAEAILAISEKNIAEAWKEVQAFRAYLGEITRLKSAVSFARHTVWEQMNTKIEVDAYHKFIQEFGDPELWEGHKKTLNGKHALPSAGGFTDGLDALITPFVEQGAAFSGKTVRALLAEWGNQVKRETEPPVIAPEVLDFIVTAKE